MTRAIIRAACWLILATAVIYTIAAVDAQLPGYQALALAVVIVLILLAVTIERRDARRETHRG